MKLPDKVTLFSMDLTPRVLSSWTYESQSYNSQPRCVFRVIKGEGTWTASVLVGGLRIPGKPRETVREAEESLYQQLAHVDDTISSDIQRLQRTRTEGPESIQFMKWTLTREGPCLTYRLQQEDTTVTVGLEQDDSQAIVSAHCALSLAMDTLQVFHEVGAGDLSSVLYELEAKVRATLLTISSSAKAIALKAPLKDHGVSQ